VVTCRFFLDAVSADVSQKLPPRQWWALPGGSNSRDRFNSAVSDAPNGDWAAAESSVSSFLPCDLQSPTPLGFGETAAAAAPGKQSPPVRRSSKGQTIASDGSVNSKSSDIPSTAEWSFHRRGGRSLESTPQKNSSSSYSGGNVSLTAQVRLRFEDCAAVAQSDFTNKAAIPLKLMLSALPDDVELGFDAELLKYMMVLNPLGSSANSSLHFTGMPLREFGDHSASGQSVLFEPDWISKLWPDVLSQLRKSLGVAADIEPSKVKPKAAHSKPSEEKLSEAVKPSVRTAGNGVSFNQRGMLSMVPQEKISDDPNFPPSVSLSVSGNQDSVAIQTTVFSCNASSPATRQCQVQFSKRSTSEFGSNTSLFDMGVPSNPSMASQHSTDSLQDLSIERSQWILICDGYLDVLPGGKRRSMSHAESNEVTIFAIDEFSM
jgi:hypothetical protein